VCGDMDAYIGGSLLVCVRCTVRKILIGHFNNCNFSKHE